MEIKFEKWQGLGNDFIILNDNIASSDLAIKMCDRNFGIGADGLFCPTESDEIFKIPPPQSTKPQE